MDYRKLTNAEIDRLKSQGCESGDWAKIVVKDPFDCNRLKNVALDGVIELGVFSGNAKLAAGVERPCGVYDSRLSDCSIGDNNYLADVASMAHYDTGVDVVVENVGTLAVTGSTPFGNGVELDVVNEAGGRSVKMFDRLSSQIAYLLAFYRDNGPLIDRLNGMIDDYVATRVSARGSLGRGVRISNVKRISNVRIGEFAHVDGAGSLEEGTIDSNQETPVFIGSGVVARKFIVLSGSKVDQGAILDKCFVGQSVKMGKQYSAENSLFFCNSELFHGEACSLFAGPYTVTHHKSTLLIAGYFSFYNAGSGSNQSNHMYKLGPVHQGVLERGSKTGSFSYLSWENRVGAFTNVIGKHYANFDTSDLPFSLIRESGGKSLCVPGWNLSTVGMKRDGMKWPARDGRKGSKLDLIHFQVLSPYVIWKILRGGPELSRLAESVPQGQERFSFNGVLIDKKAVKTSAETYELAVRIFIGDCLLKKLDPLGGVAKMKDVLSALASNVDKELVRWLDIGGMLAPEPAVRRLLVEVVEEKVKDIASLQARLEGLYGAYTQAEWSWCAKLIESRTKKAAGALTAQELKSIIDDWKTASQKLNTMILEDARKEFSPESRLSYGVDGDEAVRNADFDAVRGSYEKNSFVKSVNDNNVAIESRAASASEFLAKLS